MSKNSEHYTENERGCGGTCIIKLSAVEKAINIALHDPSTPTNRVFNSCFMQWIKINTNPVLSEKGEKYNMLK